MKAIISRTEMAAPPPETKKATMEGYCRPCDEVGFNADKAHNIVKECVDGVLGGYDYNQNDINRWTASTVEQSVAHLVKPGKAHKYIVRRPEEPIWPSHSQLLCLGYNT